MIQASPSLFGEKGADLDPDDDGPPFILREHKLAIAFWCIPPLFKFAANSFNEMRKTLEASRECCCAVMSP